MKTCLATVLVFLFSNGAFAYNPSSLLLQAEGRGCGTKRPITKAIIQLNQPAYLLSAPDMTDTTHIYALLPQNATFLSLGEAHGYWIVQVDGRRMYIGYGFATCLAAEH